MKRAKKPCRQKKPSCPKRAVRALRLLFPRMEFTADKLSRMSGQQAEITEELNALFGLAMYVVCKLNRWVVVFQGTWVVEKSSDELAYIADLGEKGEVYDLFLPLSSAVTSMQTVGVWDCMHMYPGMEPMWGTATVDVDSGVMKRELIECLPVWNPDAKNPEEVYPRGVGMRANGVRGVPDGVAWVHPNGDLVPDLTKKEDPLTKLIRFLPGLAVLFDWRRRVVLRALRDNHKSDRRAREGLRRLNARRMRAVLRALRDSQKSSKRAREGLRRSNARRMRVALPALRRKQSTRNQHEALERWRIRKLRGALERLRERAVEQIPDLQSVTSGDDV